MMDGFLNGLFVGGGWIVATVALVLLARLCHDFSAWHSMAWWHVGDFILLWVWPLVSLFGLVLLGNVAFQHGGWDFFGPWCLGVLCTVPVLIASALISFMTG